MLTLEKVLLSDECKKLRKGIEKDGIKAAKNTLLFGAIAVAAGAKAVRNAVAWGSAAGGEASFRMLDKIVQEEILNR